jgi:hypothetical protein
MMEELYEVMAWAIPNKEKKEKSRIYAPNLYQNNFFPKKKNNKPLWFYVQ